MAAPLHGSVLLVDDDHAIRESVTEILTDAGYDVRCAQNGHEALDEMNGPDRPDLVLLDLVMPVVSGFDVIAAWRQTETLATIPILVMSASHSALLVNDDYQVASLHKPFTVDELLDAVSQQLHTRPPEPVPESTVEPTPRLD